VKIIADSNLLLRAVLADDARQARVAMRTMAQAEIIAVSRHALCELVWVLERSYGVSRGHIAATLRQLRDTQNVLLDRPALEAGLAVLDAGGDFADGVIAYEGEWLGGDTFVSFDKKAVLLLSAQDHHTHLLS
jgi:predicted nucleic-acid-binding protein